MLVYSCEFHRATQNDLRLKQFMQIVTNKQQDELPDFFCLFSQHL